MRIWTELNKLCSDVEKLAACDLHGVAKENKLTALKNEIAVILRILFGENSREVKVIRQTTSTATIIKVIKHLDSRRVNDVDTMAVNM
ncbi:hypothetical protein LPY66_10920 [Dehalobacter sp. DCM]|uniref:hypothetical protein n=1 Tax=Dehalobacter sp. DCM TaxID=2907827 RepID=UPI003081ADA9|nr:hypothetical protein LPY66_10920 [Dehalobacter sp. DCM]